MRPDASKMADGLDCGGRVCSGNGPVNGINSLFLEKWWSEIKNRFFNLFKFTWKSDRHEDIIVYMA